MLAHRMKKSVCGLCNRSRVRTYNGAAILFLNAAAHPLMVMVDVQKREGNDARNGKFERKESCNTKRRRQNKLFVFFLPACDYISANSCQRTTGITTRKPGRVIVPSNNGRI